MSGNGSTTSSRREPAWIWDEVAAARAAGRWILKTDHWVTVVAVIGSVLYGSLRIAYLSFYGQFGLRPEDVGLGYGEVLGQTVTGLVLLSAVVLIVTFVAACAVVTYAVVWDQVWNNVWSR